MSGLITDLPIRVCPSCTAIFVQDDRIYEDPSVCPRCGSDLAAALREGVGGRTRTVPFNFLVTEEGDGLATENEGLLLRTDPSSRWG